MSDNKNILSGNHQNQNDKKLRGNYKTKSRIYSNINLTKSQYFLMLYLKFIEKEEISNEEIKEIINNNGPKVYQTFLNELRAFFKHEEYQLHLQNFNEYFTIHNIECCNDQDELEYNQLLDQLYDDEQYIVPEIISNKRNRTQTLKNFKYFNKKHALILIKLLLDSRALSNVELINVINDVLKHLSNTDRKKVMNSIKSEVNKYIQLTHKKSIIDLIWDLNEYIYENKTIKIEYQNMGKKNKEHIVKPLYITQDEFYFYLICFSSKNYFMTLRIDRIIEVELEHNHAPIKIDSLPYTKELGALKNLAPLMYNGKKESIKIEFTGISEEAILDKFPINSIEKKDGKTIITIETIGEGVYMWLLSQGDNIKVISPESVKQEMKRRIQNMMDLYQ
ncbi:WYL domain-containing protein [Macrococcoides canis]|uniref:helix-turn-helix transcriptional regulator n=1 Tax=Macrococcoides canis TaxID=1855823 RepID=UPI0020B79989|nr:WYL domain-containing protein [Macrococcus canis]UTH02879.1 WYL domain-containing protein [Macrococcus canis]